MPSEDCEDGLTTTISILDTEDHKVTLRMVDQVLAQLIHDVIDMDKRALAQKLFSLEPVSLVYNKESLMVTRINQ